jgi:glycosyltransferase involved in cell wall biosynthesis
MPLKSAYELACDRIIAPREIKNESQEPTFDFIDIPEFSNRADKVIESTGDSESIAKKREEKKMNPNPIKVAQPESIHYDQSPMEVCWAGHFQGYHGFDRMNRMFVFGLANKGVSVNIEVEPYISHINKATQEQLDILSRLEISPTAPKVFGMTLPMRLNHAGRKIAYTMIETSERVHPDYAGKLNLCNEIWTPTRFGEKILRKSGVHPPIYIMPLGVDANRYVPGLKSLNVGELKDFRFLSVFRWSPRKAPDVLLRSYLEEFNSNDNVTMLIVSRIVETAEELSAQKIIEEFNGIKAGINKKEEDLPHVALYVNPIPEKDMPNLYNAADAFVLISRGEGMGLPYLEAGSCELPVIASNCSGQTDFLNNDNSFLVEPDGYIEAKVNGNLSRMAKQCRFYENQMFPDFGQKAIDSIKQHMRFVFENREKAKEKAKQLRKDILANFTWDIAIDKVYNRLREIKGK